jgi:raffinose/stachyose/melibiose transport system substrate-binding protein
MKLRKVVAMFTLVAMMGTLFVGCSNKAASDNNEGNTVSEEANSGDKGTEGEGQQKISGTITIFEHEYSYEDSLKEVIEGFNKLYPNVDVKYEIKAGQEYYSILSTAIQSGDGPDLFWTNGAATSNMADYVSNGVCYDLTNAVDYSLYDESAMNLTKVDGKSYSIPWLTLDTRAVYYNKDLFNENGWKIPKTFSEFENLLGTIKTAGYTPISLSPADPYCLLFAFEPILAAYDVNYTKGLADNTVSATDKPVKDVLDLMLGWADKGYFGDNWLGVADNNAQILGFTSGKAAMNIAGSWDAATISQNNPDLNFGAFVIPTEDGTTGLVGTPANGFSVNAVSKNLDAAVAFANYCASLEAQKIWVQSQGAVSASPDIEASSEIAKEISSYGNGNIYRSWQNVLSTNSTAGKAATIFSNDFPVVFSKILTVDDFLKEISDVMK